MGTAIGMMRFRWQGLAAAGEKVACLLGNQKAPPDTAPGRGRVNYGLNALTQPKPLRCKGTTRYLALCFGTCPLRCGTRPSCCPQLRVHEAEVRWHAVVARER